MFARYLSDAILTVSWMYKTILLSLVLLLVFNQKPAAQGKFWNSRNACLAQTPPTDTPRIFARDLLEKRDTFSMDRPAFSADGKEFYYVTNTTWFNGTNVKVRYLKYEGGKWNGPFVLNEQYSAPTFSMDGKTLYFLGGKGDGKHSFVWQSQRKPDGGWTTSSVYLMKDYGLYDFMPTLSGVCYVGSNGNQGKRTDFSTYDFCTLTFNVADTVVQSLGPVINTPAFDGDFYVARDESYMIISYKEKPDYECKLGITFRKADHSWATPQDLGPLINDGDAHRWGEYVTPDGKYLFYSKGTSPKDCHLYWVRFDRLLKKLQKESLSGGAN